MSRNKYPKRTVKQEWYYKNFLFDREKKIVVSVNWNQNKHKYEIAYAYIADNPPLPKHLMVEDYPFVKSKHDRSFVKAIVQISCAHSDIEYYPHHACCVRCAIVFTGSFRDKAKEQMIKNFPKMENKDMEEYLNSFKPGGHK